MNKLHCEACEREVAELTGVHGVRSKGTGQTRHNRMGRKTYDLPGHRTQSVTSPNTPYSKGVRFDVQVRGWFCLNCSTAPGTRFRLTDTGAGDKRIGFAETLREKPRDEKFISNFEESVILAVTCESCSVQKTEDTCMQCGRYICTARGCRVTVDGLIACRECSEITSVFTWRYDTTETVMDDARNVVIWSKGRPLHANLLGHRELSPTPLVRPVV